MRVTAAQRPLRGIRLRIGERASMTLIAIAIGVAGGFGAIFFRWLIDALQRLAWPDAASPLAMFRTAPWYWRIAVPAAGGLLVGLIVKFLAPEAKGHGVPEVMNAVARLGGVIRPVVAVAKSFASAICIASGGSVGREGPIVQIGAAVGSTVGQLLRLSARRIRTCVGCGAAAGIAATFNAPIAGAFFASEIILGEFSVGAFGIVVISSVTATVISRSFLGNIPAFEIPAYELVNPAEMITYVLLGLLAAVAAVGFVQTLHWSEEFFERLKRIPGFLQPVIGGLGIGCLALVLPEVMGVGYDTITASLRAELALGFLALVLVAKLLATSFTLGSGGSGGIFAPSLFMGAALGAAVGKLARAVFPFTMAHPGAYAVVGMGAMVAAATHAPITAILIIFEMTGDYRVILGLMVSCILGTFIAQRLRRESIYTIKLIRRGIDLQAGQEINVLRKLHVRDVLRREIELVPRTAPLDDLYRHMVESQHYEFFTVDEQGGLVGVISVDDLRRNLPHLEGLRAVTIAEDLAVSPAVYVREDDTLDTAMRQFGKRTFEELPVLPAGESRVPIGTIMRHDVINAYNKEILKVDLPGALSARIDSAARMRTWETVGGYVLAQLECAPQICGRDLAALDLRQRRGIQIILVERPDAPGEERFALPTRETILRHGDRIVIFGRREDVDELARECC
ncbi:MAG: CBS domain-containing protein [Candidatus Eisenbacteria bacterium]|nr:CBS domain-containing protein [Candidatus Eisenbacteria bacterium]